MYQKKEYKLQLIEFKKSVKAQTKSSEALDEQKKILLEQNANSLIFGLIENFNDYKIKNNTQKFIDSLVEHYQAIFALRWHSNFENSRMNKNELNERFANEIKQILNETIYQTEEYQLFKRYIQLIYNIFYIIDQNKNKVSQDYFTPFFHTQLNTNESIMLYLSNLIDGNMPIYTNLYWGYYSTEEITNLIIKYPHQNIDFTEIDKRILTTEFNKLKQIE